MIAIVKNAMAYFFRKEVIGVEDLFTERLKLKDILPEKADKIAKEYNLNKDNIEFIRKKNPLNADDLKIEDGERAAVRYVNTADIGRDNEIVLPSGLDVTDFQKSPSVLYAHNYGGLPIGKDIWIKHVSGKGWLAKTVYATHQLANDVYNLVKEKFLNTSSIGFIPLESVTPEDKDWEKVKENIKSEYSIKDKVFDKVRRIYTKSLLLEHSDVPIPSNINALNVAVGKGLEIKSKELIEDLNITIKDEDEFVIKDEEGNITKPEETDDYIRIPVRSCDVTATITISASEGIKALYCGKIKKVRTYLFAKDKGWTLESAKAWVKEHDKSMEITEDMIKTNDKTYTIKEIQDIIGDDQTKVVIVQDSKILKENEDLKSQMAEMELKYGAVLNKKNKNNLKNAQDLIQDVLDSSEEDDENININDEDKDKVKIDEKDLSDIIASVMANQIDSTMKKIEENVIGTVRQDMENNFKKITGKIM